MTIFKSRVTNAALLTTGSYSLQRLTFGSGETSIAMIGSLKPASAGNESIRMFGKTVELNARHGMLQCPGGGSPHSRGA
eukprot:scaffold651425_cov14-Prasinocladus_malaysianus.AAC.1